MNSNKISSRKRNRVERLRTRMENYRQRSKLQETIQIKRTSSAKGPNPIGASGFNLFCREFQSGMNQTNNSDYQHNINSFDETFFDTNPAFNNNFLHKNDIFLEPAAFEEIKNSNYGCFDAVINETNIKPDLVEMDNSNTRNRPRDAFIKCRI